jgi:hypothetical protein
VRRAKRAQGRRARRLFPDKEGRRALPERVRSSGALTNRFRVRARSSCKVGHQSERRRPGLRRAAALNKQLQGVPWRGGGRGVFHRKVRRVVSSEGERGALAQAPSCDRGRQRSRRHGLAPSAEGRRGSAANAGSARASPACCAGRSRAEAATAKNCGIGKRSRQRELLDPPSETGSERGCHVAPRA